MDKELKQFIEDNFDYLVKLYNRYIKFNLRKLSLLEYYASPYMNLQGYPSDIFIIFCTKYYNKKYNLNIKYKKNASTKVYISAYQFFKIWFLYIFAFLFFSKQIKKNSVVIHGFHTDNDFKNNPYKTSKSPPLEYFKEKNIYHDINISFISMKSLFKYKKNNITCSIRYIDLWRFLELHFIALKIYIQNVEINLFQISYIDILYTLLKGVGISELINQLDRDSMYLNMWENRGYHRIIDLLIKDNNKMVFLDLGITFRLAPNYMMFNHLRDNLKSKILFMSQYNYNLVKDYIKLTSYGFFRNYRINCNFYNKKGKENSILLLSPLSLPVTKELYQLIIKNPNKNIKIKLHPFIEQSLFDKKYIEKRGLYELLDDYDTIVYSGITTAAVELYFQNKKIYKYVSNEFLDIDPLVDNNLVKKIYNLNEINNFKYNENIEELRDYYLGCNNKELDKVL